MRTRTTQGRRERKATAQSVLADIEARRNRRADADAELEADAEAIADNEAAVTQDSIPGPELSEDIGDENARANDNWPVEDREAVASSLLVLAKKLLEE